MLSLPGENTESDLKNILSLSAEEFEENKGKVVEYIYALKAQENQDKIKNALNRISVKFLCPEACTDQSILGSVEETVKLRSILKSNPERIDCSGIQKCTYFPVLSGYGLVVASMNKDERLANCFVEHRLQDGRLIRFLQKVVQDTEWSETTNDDTQIDRLFSSNVKEQYRENYGKFKFQVLKSMIKFLQECPSVRDFMPGIEPSRLSPENCALSSVMNRHTSTSELKAHVHTGGLAMSPGSFQSRFPLASAVYYPFTIPESASGEGYLSLGTPDFDVHPDITIDKAYVRPEEGKLVIFPSFVFHKVEPSNLGSRYSIAFDLYG